jgi:hypothetical protein
MRIDSAKAYGSGAVLICALVALLVVSCATPADRRRDAKIEQHKRFLNKTYDRQHQAFQVFPIEMQFDIYIMATTMFAPPEMSFAVDIAKTRRGRAVPYLIKMLGQENFPDYGKEQGVTDDIKEKTIFIFRTLSRLDLYDVASDETAIAAIKKAIAEMEVPASRRKSQNYLDEIMGGK